MDFNHLILLVLPGIWEAREYSGHSVSRGDLAGVNHDEKLYKVVVDLSSRRLDNVDIFSADRFANLHPAKYGYTSG